MISMKLREFLPDNSIAMKKCENFYDYEESAEISRKNYRQIFRTYLFAAILLFACLAYTFYELNKGNKAVSDVVLLFLIAASIFFMIYRMRYSSIDRLIKTNKIDIVHALPHLIDRVILLLNAGMFIEGAIVKISEDNRKREGSFRQNTLFLGLTDLIIKSEESNSSLIHELSLYAIKSGVREFIRFSSIVENNFDKGDDLVEKLEGEGMLLWMERKKQVEEKAKLAGTKLSLPLILLLISLIMITSAPMLLSI